MKKRIAISLIIMLWGIYFCIMGKKTRQLSISNVGWRMRIGLKRNMLVGICIR